MKRLRWILVVMIGCAIGYVDVRTHRQPAAGNLPPEFDAVSVGLRGRFADVTFNDTPLPQVLAQLANLYHTNIQVDLSEGKAMLFRHSTVNLNLKHVELETVLQQILYGTQFNDIDLDFDIRETGIVVGNEGPLSRSAVTRVYDVGPIIKLAMSHKLQWPDEAPSFDGRPPSNIADEVVLRLITNDIRPTTWRENGGELGSIRRFSDDLILVKTTRKIHDEIAKALNRHANGPVTITTQPVQR